MIRHDGDVVEEFVRHTARFVDEMYVFDNVSLDSSADVLRSLQAEGLPLVIRDIDSMTARNWNFDNVTRQIWGETDADFLAVIDADEFLISPSRASFEAELGELPEQAHGILPWTTYVPTPNDDRADPRTLVRIQHRLAREQKQFTKLVYSRAYMEQARARTLMGAHEVDDAPTQTLRTARLGHFPVRSVAQLQAKGLLGWSSFLAMGYDEAGGFGYQWRRLYDELRAKPVWSDADFFHYARTYLDPAAAAPPELVHAPIPPVERRYVVPEQNLSEVAFAFTRQLAKAVGRLMVDNNRLYAELAARERPKSSP